MRLCVLAALVTLACPVAASTACPAAAEVTVSIGGRDQTVEVPRGSIRRSREGVAIAQRDLQPTKAQKRKGYRPHRNMALASTAPLSTRTLSPMEARAGECKASCDLTNTTCMGSTLTPMSGRFPGGFTCVLHGSDGLCFQRSLRSTTLLREGADGVGRC